MFDQVFGEEFLTHVANDTAPNSVPSKVKEVSSPSWRRADIQGLRAIAVIAVIAYHAGLPIPGGFTGVDIFFVISGFVITEMLFREKIATGAIKLRTFYMRRFRRLMPALAVLVSVTIVAGWLIYTSQSAQDLTAQTGLGAMFFGANVVIAMTTGNYFDAPAEANPLLHTWSLSVEEQFYFVFPAILLVGWSMRKVRSTKIVMSITLVTISLISFGLAVWGASEGVQKADSFSWLIGFYSPFTRFWEFSVGALIALALPQLKLGFRTATVLSFLGLVIGATGLLLISDQTPFPGTWTLLPVAATALLLIGGTRSSVFTRALSTGPMVKTGDWSYSLYLWHWPFIVFAIYIWPGLWYVPLIAALISFIPALASFYAIEQRFRKPGTTGKSKNWKLILPTWTIPSVLALALIMSSSLAWIPNPSRATTNQIYAGEIGFGSMESTLLEYRNTCGPFPLPALPGMTEERITCIQSLPSDGIEIAIIGDSHALALYPGFVRAFPENNVAWLDTKGGTDSSHPNFQEILSFVNSQPSIRVVILSAFWALRGVDPEGIQTALRSLVSNGKTSIITDDIPSFEFGPERCAIGNDSALQPLCDQDRAIFDSEREKYAPAIIEAAAKTPGALFIKTSDLFCSDAECSMLRDNVIQFADSNHVNFEGSDLLTSVIAEQGNLNKLLESAG